MSVIQTKWHLRIDLGEERGSALTLFAVMAPVFILFLALALDVGNWYAHKRQLQNKADAGALAAAVDYGFKFPDCVTDATLASQIQASAQGYGGATYNAGTPQGPTDTAVNSSSYGGMNGSDGGGPCFNHDSTVPGDSNYNANAPADWISPHGGYWTDVKTRETNIPTFFGAFGINLPSVGARARVAVLTAESITGLRPFAVANAADTPCAWAEFNKGGSTVEVPLSLDAGSVTDWHGTTPGSIGTMPSSDVPVDVKVGSCTDTSQQVTFPNVGYINSYKTAGPYPEIEGIFLNSSNGCNAYYVWRLGPPCQVGVRAIVHFTAPSSPTVTVNISGNSGSGATGGTLNLVNTPAGSDTWISNSFVTINPGDGSNQFNGPLQVSAKATNKNGSGNTVTTQFGLQQQIMAGDDNQEGDVKDFTLSQTSLNNHQSMVGIDIHLKMHALDSDTRGDPPTVIRSSVQDSHNRSGAVDCNNGGPALPPFVSAIINGCPDKFVVNTRGYVCTPVLTPKADCIDGVPGKNGNSVTSAYSSLWAPGNVCSANNWAAYPNIPRGDKRLIVVFVTTYGAEFRKSGNPQSPYPIATMAAFYVTGWDGSPNSCNGVNEAYPPATSDKNNASKAAVWGHFIKFVVPPSGGTPSPTPCDVQSVQNSVSVCIASLVR